MPVALTFVNGSTPAVSGTNLNSMVTAINAAYIKPSGGIPVTDLVSGALAGVPRYIVQNTDGSWPLRNTVISGATDPVVWVQWVASSNPPTSGGGYANNAATGAKPTDFLLTVI